MKRQVLSAILASFLIFISIHLSAQVGINTDNSQPDPSAILDAKSTSKGLLVPRMTQSQISLIASPANGLIVFCTTDNKFYAYMENGGVWQEIAYGTGTIAPFVIPTVATTAVTGITPTEASSGGDVTDDGGTPVTARGVCWGTSANPTTADSHTADGTGTGVFLSSVTGLASNTFCYLRSYATNTVGTAYGDELTFSTLAFSIGLSYGGGIIFYIDGTGQHGLISATSDQSAGAQWGCQGTLIGTSLTIGTGQANTTAIVNGCSTMGIAARICDDLLMSGYDDWFLPSKDELNQMYLQKTLIGGFAETLYWSSSETPTGIHAWTQSFTNGTQYNILKAANYYVRAIRAF